jgi:sigma-B regulation protein RsbU (phosphoserine phosphatase)
MMDFKNLDEIIFRLNRLICRNSRGERFITAFVGLYKSAEKKLVYINCGHLPPLLFLASGSVVSLRTGSTVLGIFDELPKLQAGSEIVNGPVLLVAFTDGLAEVVDSTGEEFGDERLEQYFAENRNEKMAVMHQRLLNRLDNFSGDQGFGDDLTLLTIRFGGE